MPKCHKTYVQFCRTLGEFTNKCVTLHNLSASLKPDKAKTGIRWADLIIIPESGGPTYSGCSTVLFRTSGIVVTLIPRAEIRPFTGVMA